MTHDPEQHDPPTPEQEPAMPAALASLLRERTALDAGPLAEEAGVEPRVDEAVMRAAREQLDEIPPPRSIFLPALLRTVGTCGIAAAAIGFVVFFGPSQTAPVNAPPAQQNAPQSSPLRGEDARLAQETEAAGRADGEVDAMDLAFMDDQAETEEFARIAPETLADTAATAPQPAAALASRAAAPRVTIVDAYAIALALESGAPFKNAIDANRDGAIDSADVEAIATASVRLDRTGLLSRAKSGVAPVLGFALSPALFEGSVLR